ncbi:MAG: hypothetical protein JST50_09530 [Bacteroidetes bacterium]|jgi:hypothetical protein|nr:hypothetical protein [Bacteroidota bacterium]
MNLYFLLEGASTEVKFYPKLVESIFEDRLLKINKVSDVTGQDHSYFILTGSGYPQIYTHILADTLSDILQYRDFTHLFICIDSDELSIDDRIAEFKDIYERFLEDGLNVEEFCEVNLIIQYRCIESWFLGNKRFYKQNSNNPDMLKFNQFYNVKLQDPEQMGFDIDYDSHASYHYAYLRQMIRENRRQYNKSNPSTVCEASYIQRLKERFYSDQHIGSFGYLIIKLSELNDKLTGD